MLMHLHCKIYAPIIMLHQRCIKDVQLDGIKMPQKYLQRRKTLSSICIDIQALNAIAMHLHCNVYAKKRKGKYIYTIYSLSFIYSSMVRKLRFLKSISVIELNYCLEK